METSKIVIRRKNPSTDISKVKSVSDWKPIHELIATLYATGYKQIDIARQLNVSPFLVNKTVNSIVGRERVKILQERHADLLVKTRDGKVQRIKESSLDNIHDVVTDKELAKKKPFDVFDRSLQALKAFGGAVDDSSTNTNIHNNNINVLVANPEFAKRISSGLEKILRIEASRG